jgi:glutamate-ammonia-ligase adenylyltransferase
MPDPDKGALRAELIGRHPAPWVDHVLASFQDAYFEAFDAHAIDRHLRLIRELGDEHPVRFETRPGDLPGEWWLEVVGYDAFQFLSTLCMMLTVQGLSIQEAWIFTSEPPTPAVGGTGVAPVSLQKRPAAPRLARPGQTPPPRDRPDRRRKLVDVILVRQTPFHGQSPNWDAFLAELMALVRLLHDGRHDEVLHRLLGRFVARLERSGPEDVAIEPFDVTIDPEGSEFATVVKVHARDSLGFLSLTASALSLCGIRIVQADVRTPGRGRVNDTFWVTDRAGRKITAEPRVRELRLSLTLIEHFSSRLPHAANPESALVHFSRFANDVMTRPDWATDFAAIDRPEVLGALVRVLGESDFLWHDYLRDQPELVLPLISDPAQWDIAPDSSTLAASLEDGLTSAGIDPEARRRVVRRFRDREVFRAGLRAILGRTPSMETFSAELTIVAEVLMRATFREALDEAGRKVFRHQAARPAPGVLCSLGKFGGCELGFASDLELMVIFDDEQQGQPATAEFFDQVVRELRAVLAARVGGTFELDFRLRPYGKAGPPATSLTAFETYYQPGGPAWGYERQALIKLRPISGDPELAARLIAHRDRFVYGPEPFDSAGLRQMREMQVRQLVKPGTLNAKFSPGGLVDVEYFVQSKQIQYGREDLALRSPNTLAAIEALRAASHLDDDQAVALRMAYRFHRRLIDNLRVVHGHAKDLTVPPEGSDEFGLLARRMRRTSPEVLRAEMDEQFGAVRAIVGDPS